MYTLAGNKGLIDYKTIRDIYRLSGNKVLIDYKTVRDLYTIRQ